MTQTTIGADVAIDIRAVTKHYGHVLAVDNLDLSVRRGEFLTLLGPSGCGKTTTLRTIGGFEYPDSGSVSVLGRDVTALPPFSRPVNTVFQKYALFPHLTVAENIAYGLKAAGMAKSDQKARVRQMLTLVQLDGVEDRRPRELSGGQQQRIALARALAPKPEVLLLDEPLGSLDYKLRKEMQVELKEIHHQLGTTFVYVTHDQEEALAMSDRVCVMRKGRIVQDGTPIEIYHDPSTKYVAEFVGNMNFVSGRVVAADATSVDVVVEGVGTLRARATATLAVGDRVSLGIRHEDIRLADAGSDAVRSQNSFEALCLESMPIGSVTRLALQSGPERYLADIARSDSPRERGDGVIVTFPEARLRAFPEGS